MKHISLSILLLLCSKAVTFGQNTPPDYLQKMPEDSVKVDSLLELGRKTQYVNTVQSSRYFGDALKISQKMGDRKREGLALLKMGSNENLLENFPEALNHLQQAFQIFEALKMHERMIRAELKMAQVYENQQDKTSALRYFEKTLALAQTYHSENNEAYALEGIAGIESEKKNYGKVIEYRQKALKIHEKHKDIESYTITNYNLALTFKNLKQYDKSLGIIQKSLAYWQQKNDSIPIAEVITSIGEIYLEKKDYSLAEKKMKESLSFLGKIQGTSQLKSKIYGVLKTIYQAQNNFPDAYYALEKQVLWQDSTNIEAKNKTFATLQTKFETVQKEAQIKDLDQQNETKRNQLIYAIIGLSVLAILLGLSVFLYRKLQHNKAKVDAQAKQLSTLMKELHHRVKNNLAIVSSLLSLQSSRLEDEKAAKAVMEGQMRVEAMSLIHQRLYKTDNITTLNIKTYLTDLAESLMSAYGYHRDNFDLKISVDNPDIDVDLAMPIGLIVNELVTNSFKYAYQNTNNPSLKIDLKNDKEITLKVHDNGIGINEATMNKKTDSFGKQLIKALAKQTKGQYKFENKNGTYFELHIPKLAVL